MSDIKSDLFKPKMVKVLEWILFGVGLTITSISMYSGVRASIREENTILIKKLDSIQNVRNRTFLALIENLDTTMSRYIKKSQGEINLQRKYYQLLRLNLDLKTENSDLKKNDSQIPFFNQYPKDFRQYPIGFISAPNLSFTE